MTVRFSRSLAVALGLSAGGGLAAAAPPAPAAAAPTANQQLADQIAGRLSAAPAARGADLGVSAQGGVVSLVGSVSQPAQKAAVLDIVRVVPGVTQVRDGIKVGGVVQAQATAPPATLPPTFGGPMAVGPVATPAPVGMPPVGPGGPVIEPAPIGTPGMTAGADAPPLPPYAWPTYAPYNNYSRVAYPQAYPHNAFPFIGPFYPFPKVPPGWRSVKLEWEDGHWFFGRTSTGYDYWRARFQ